MWKSLATARLRRVLRMANESASVRLGGLLVVFVALVNWVYYFAERTGPHQYRSYAEALIDSLILLFSGWSLSDPPATKLGFVAAFSVLIAGIAFVAMIFGDAASYLVGRALGRNRGLRRLTVKGHILVCNWNEHSKLLVDQLLEDEASRTAQIAIVADVTEHPYPEAGIGFVTGSPTRDEVLTKACVDTAATAIITGSDNDAVTSDSLAIMTALAVEARNPSAYTCVLISDPSNRCHLSHARVDEVVCVGEMTSGILAQAALNHGLTSLLHQLMSFGEGCEIYKVRLPHDARGLGFLEIAHLMLEDYRATLLAIETKVEGETRIVTCPSHFDDANSGDHAFIYAESFPEGLSPSTPALPKAG